MKRPIITHRELPILDPLAARSVILVPEFGCDGDLVLELCSALENSNEAYRLQVADVAGCKSLADACLLGSEKAGGDYGTLGAER